VAAKKILDRELWLQILKLRLYIVCPALGPYYKNEVRVNQPSAAGRLTHNPYYKMEVGVTRSCG